MRDCEAMLLLKDALEVVSPNISSFEAYKKTRLPMFYHCNKPHGETLLVFTTGLSEVRLKLCRQDCLAPAHA